MDRIVESIKAPAPQGCARAVQAGPPRAAKEEGAGSTSTAQSTEETAEGAEAPVPEERTPAPREGPPRAGAEGGGSGSTSATLAFGGGSQDCPLSWLPDTTLAGLWPADKVFHVICVGSKSLTRALRSAPAVSLHGMKVKEWAGKALAAALAPMTELIDLDLGKSGLSDDCVLPLIFALARMPRLKKLSLKDSRCKPFALATIMAGLPAGLTHLNLEGNHLGDRGAKAVAECLPEGLVYLFLQDNEIGLEGCKALARQLPPDLEHIDLGYCMGGLMRIIAPGSSAKLDALLPQGEGLDLMDDDIDAGDRNVFEFIIGEVARLHDLPSNAARLENAALHVRQSQAALELAKLGQQPSDAARIEALEGALVQLQGTLMQHQPE